MNLTGVFHTAKAAVPHLLATGDGGSIVFTSSVSGIKGTPFTGHYAATKHGIVGLAKTMANELGEQRIRVNTVHPAGVETGMTVTDLHPLIAEYGSTLGPIYMNSLPYQILQADDVARWLRGCARTKPSTSPVLRCRSISATSSAESSKHELTQVAECSAVVADREREPCRSRCR